MSGHRAFSALGMAVVLRSWRIGMFPSWRGSTVPSRPTLARLLVANVPVEGDGPVKPGHDGSLAITTRGSTLQGAA